LIGTSRPILEQSVTGFTGEFQTYHYWTPAPACTYEQNQLALTIPDIATAWHKYAVVRNNGTTFYVDGVVRSWHGKSVWNSNFQNYPMTVQMGVGGYNAYPPNNSQLPAYVYIRHIRVWNWKGIPQAQN